VAQLTTTSRRSKCPFGFDQSGPISSGESAPNDTPDIWSSPEDAIGSVANYLKRHGWEAQRQVVMAAQETGDGYRALLTDNLRPDVVSDELASHGIQQIGHIAPGTKVKLISLESGAGNEVWLGFNNFYVITRYNRSPLYAMAVYQLYEEVLKKYRPNLTGYR